MLKRSFWRLGFVAGLALAAYCCVAQRFGGGWGPEGWFPGVDNVKTAREADTHSTGTPIWTNEPAFAKDVFTFARVRYHRQTRAAWRAGYWFSDFPDSDLNLSYRVQQMTSIKVNPDGRGISLMDKDLPDYPWIYMVEPGLMILEDEEVAILRKHLLNGGFLMADDFWGTPQWNNFERQIKRVFPNRTFVELPMDHPLFQCVYPMEGPKSKLQVPNVKWGRKGGADETGVTWETHDGEVCKDIHIRAMFDDKGHLMILACHNTDYGDSWEREGEDDYYFHHFSENLGYPLGINIISYVMTH